MTTSDIMVHYDRPFSRTAQQPPRICPKCGSHRTEVVGISEDGRTLNVRCNACGARSTVPVEPEQAVTPELPEAQAETLSIEGVSEMFDEGSTLAEPDTDGLPDLFAQAGALAELDIEGVSEMFEEADDTSDDSDLAVDFLQPSACDDRPLASLVREFAADLRWVASAWQL